MQGRLWLCGAASALALAFAAPASQAAPLGSGISSPRAAASESSGVERTHYYRYRRHYGYYAYPRYRRYHRPYRYYGYGPSFYYGYGPAYGFYGYPRYQHRWWW